uniref:Uncharacterized protein n=1 Tax=Graphocephala atropunctata TaxID=36148 RepID=A0A1B6L8T7_9HEMI
MCSRRGTGAYAKENMEEDSGKTGYKLRETDNRLNRLKNRQKTPIKRETCSVPSECGSDSNSGCSSAVGSSAVTPLSMRELRQKGLTKYDAELLLAQGTCFSDITADSFRTRSEHLVDRESRLHARNLRKSISRKKDVDDGGGLTSAVPSVAMDVSDSVSNGMSLRNHKRLSEPLIDTSSVMREKVNNNNNDLSELCSKLEKTNMAEPTESKVKRTEVSKKENEKGVAFVSKVSKRRKSVIKKVNTVLENVYSPVSRPKRILSSRGSRYNSFSETTDMLSDQPEVKSEQYITDSMPKSPDIESVEQNFISDNKVDIKKEVDVLNEKDVYEFDDQECEVSEPVSLRRLKVEEKKESDSSLLSKTDPPSEPTTPEKQAGGRLKLTLRMKRSPIVEDSSESGMNWAGEEPEYEVLRVEGVGDLEEEDLHRKKKHKNKDRERRRRKLREYLKFDDPGMYPMQVQVQPPMKRLRLILRGETQTINLPPIVPAVMS